MSWRAGGRSWDIRSHDVNLIFRSGEIDTDVDNDGKKEIFVGDDYGLYQFR